MLNKNNTSDLINYVIHVAEYAAVVFGVLLAVLYYAGPGAYKILRAVLIDPAVQQWQSPVSKWDTPAADNNMFLKFDQGSRR